MVGSLDSGLSSPGHYVVCVLGHDSGCEEIFTSEQLNQLQQFTTWQQKPDHSAELQCLIIQFHFHGS